MAEIYLKNFVEEIRPKDIEIRKQIDVSYSWDGKIAFLNEVRPQWNKPENILSLSFAK